MGSDCISFRFSTRIRCEPVSVYEHTSFPFGFENGTWDLIALAPDHCLFTVTKLILYA